MEPNLHPCSTGMDWRKQKSPPLSVSHPSVCILGQKFSSESHRKLLPNATPNGPPHVTHLKEGPQIASGECEISCPPPELAFAPLMDPYNYWLRIEVIFRGPHRPLPRATANPNSGLLPTYDSVLRLPPGNVKSLSLFNSCR